VEQTAHLLHTWLIWGVLNVLHTWCTPGRFFITHANRVVIAKIIKKTETHIEIVFSFIPPQVFGVLG